MYYIYHIDGVKIGCTKDLTKRMRDQGFTDWEILEEHTDINLASTREIELQTEFGLPIDKIPYWKTIEHAQSGSVLGGRTGKGGGNPNMSTTGEVWGKINGKLYGSTNGKLHGSANGTKSQSYSYTCPHCNKIGKGSIYFRWHGDNCKLKA